MKKKVVFPLVAIVLAMLAITLHRAYEHESMLARIHVDWSPQRLAACMNLARTIYDPYYNGDPSLRMYRWREWGCDLGPGVQQTQAVSPRWYWQEGARGGVQALVTAAVTPPRAESPQ